MINVYYCTDKKLFTQQVMSVVSLAEHTNEALNVVNLTLEVPEFVAKSKKTSAEQDAYLDSILKAKNPDSSWKSIDVSDLFREHLFAGPNMHNKFYSYFVVVRLLAHLVPEIGDKVIYLDADTIINGDIKELWDIDLTDKELAGRIDSGRIGYKYLQSGVMLLNMKAIRENKRFERACQLVTTKKYYFYIDMTAINHSIPAKKKKVFSTRFNSYKYKKDCVVYHVCGLREGKIPLTKKWFHRIKTDELELFAKYQPEYKYFVDDMYKRTKENPELFN